MRVSLRKFFSSIRRFYFYFSTGRNLPPVEILTDAAVAPHC